MKKQIIFGVLAFAASVVSLSAFACQDERDQKVERHKKLHEQTLASMSSEDKASYDKVSKIIDGFSESERNALRIKLKDEYMMMSPEQKMKLHKEHREHIKKIKEDMKKDVPAPHHAMTPQQEKDMKDDIKEPLKR